MGGIGRLINGQLALGMGIGDSQFSVANLPAIIASSRFTKIGLVKKTWNHR
jgi:hypothetical protein